MSRPPSAAAASVLVLAVLHAACVGGLKLVRLEVPQYKLRGDQALLQCIYDLEGDALYSVKWYKDDEEFYRYVPRTSPVQHSWNVEGVKVLDNISDDKKVVLHHLSLKSSGVYRCEVSAEAPSFASTQGEAHMEVVVDELHLNTSTRSNNNTSSPLPEAENLPSDTIGNRTLPKDGPQIFGEQRLYQVGDEISLNCTSGKSHPASELKWFINDQQVGVDDPRLEQLPAERDPHGLLSSWLGLRFAVTSAHFVGGSLKLRCVAEVAPVLWQGDSESVVQRVTPPPNTVREALFLVRGQSSRAGISAAVVLASILFSAVT